MLYFLLEERSMQEFLRGMVHRLFPHLKEDTHYCFRPHQGKTDLQEAIPRFFKGLSAKAGLRVMIIHDQDALDCVELKQILLKLCGDTNVPKCVRIACTELESCYIGDTTALERVYPDFASYRNRKNFRANPDIIKKPSQLLGKHLKNFQKGVAARELGKHLDITLENNRNTSRSFLVTLNAISNMMPQEA
jgi:hypothetical protein